MCAGLMCINERQVNLAACQPVSISTYKLYIVTKKEGKIVWTEEWTSHVVVHSRKGPPQHGQKAAQCYPHHRRCSAPCTIPNAGAHGRCDFCWRRAAWSRKDCGSQCSVFLEEWRIFCNLHQGEPAHIVWRSSHTCSHMSAQLYVLCHKRVTLEKQCLVTICYCFQCHG